MSYDHLRKWSQNVTIGALGGVPILIGTYLLITYLLITLIYLIISTYFNRYLKVSMATVCEKRQTLPI